MIDDERVTFAGDGLSGVLGFLAALKTPIRRIPDKRFAWMNAKEYQRVVQFSDLTENDAYVRLPDGKAFLIGTINGQGPAEHVYDPETDSWRSVL